MTNLSDENTCLALPLQSWRFKSYKYGKQFPMNMIIYEELENIDVEALLAAVNALVARHESLRVSFFVNEQGQVCQKIHDKHEFPSNVLLEDISGEEDNGAKIQAMVKDVSNHLFNFEIEQPFKCRLIKHGRDKYIFVICIDHIISDDLSIKMIKEELYVLYGAFSRNLPDPLPPCEWCLRTFVNEYYKHYQGEKCTYHQSYFQKVLQDLPEKLSFGSLNSRRNSSHGKTDESSLMYIKNGGAGYRFAMPKEISARIDSVVRELKTTHFIFILAIYTILLRKMSNFDDFIIDTPISIRNDVSLSAIGWLTGTLVTRVRMDTEMTFRSWLASCKNSVMDALDHTSYQTDDNVFSPSWFERATQLNVIYNEGINNISDSDNHHYIVENVLFNFCFVVRMFRDQFVIDCNYKFLIVDEEQISTICDHFLSIAKVVVSSQEIKVKELIEHYP